MKTVFIVTKNIRRFWTWMEQHYPKDQIVKINQSRGEFELPNRKYIYCTGPKHLRGRRGVEVVYLFDSYTRDDLEQIRDVARVAEMEL